MTLLQCVLISLSILLIVGFFIYQKVMNTVIDEKTKNFPFTDINFSDGEFPTYWRSGKYRFKIAEKKITTLKGKTTIFLYVVIQYYNLYNDKNWITIYRKKINEYNL